MSFPKIKYKLNTRLFNAVSFGRGVEKSKEEGGKEKKKKADGWRKKIVR